VSGGLGSAARRLLLEAITIEAALAMTAPSLAAEYVEEIGE